MEIKASKRSQQGQSTIEFLLTIAFSLAFLFVFVQLSINSTFGYLVHYANYMTSRAYMVFDDGNRNSNSNDNVAETFVKNNVFDIFKLDIFGISPGAINLEFHEPQFGGKYEYVGTLTRFNLPMSLLPLIGGKQTGEMISESFLGREPTRGTCLQRICEIGVQQNVGFDCSLGTTNTHVTLFDNGC